MVFFSEIGRLVVLKQHLQTLWLNVFVSVHSFTCPRAVTFMSSVHQLETNITITQKYIKNVLVFKSIFQIKYSISLDSLCVPIPH